MEERISVKVHLEFVARLLDAMKGGECTHLQPCERALRELQKTLPKTKDTTALFSLLSEHPEVCPQLTRVLADEIVAVSRDAFRLAEEVIPRLAATKKQRSLTEEEEEERSEKEVRGMLDNLRGLYSEASRVAERISAELAEEQ